MKKQEKIDQSKMENKTSTAYQPWDTEPKWVEKWDKDLHFVGEDNDPKGKYYSLAEFPYPSGTGLHMGHAFTYSVLDPFVRMKRRQGENIIYPMGWDAFGLPTENYALKTGIHPAQATKQNTDRYRNQMKRLGLSFNWEREINTTDPNYYKWTQWIFVQLFKHGLAYKKETPVGWCPSCKIILANEEIVNGKCERCGTEAEQRMQKQWLLRITQYADRLVDDLDLVDYPEYVKIAQKNWIGKTKGVIIDYPVVNKQFNISCYSTRPDTNFGATFVVVAPEHPFVTSLLNSNLKSQNSKLWNEIQNYIDQSKKKSELQRTELQKEKTGVFTGLYCLNRLTNKQMPIYVSDFVVATSGTGMVVGVPAHDERDFDFAKKYNLEIIPVVKPKNGDWNFKKSAFTDIDEATIINSEFLNGLSAKEAIEKIIDYLVEKGWGRRSTNYKLRDWIFSRQHYWGEPIPMVYCEKCAKEGVTWWETEGAQKSKLKNQNYNLKVKSDGKQEIEFMIHDSKFTIQSSDLAGWFPEAENQLPVELPEIEKYQPTETGESPLANVPEWVNTTCPVCGGSARRETDCMPNWAGSSWYFLAYPMTEKLKVKEEDFKNDIFTENKKILDFWMPVDLYMGGAEHTTLHVLYSRFWNKFLFDIGKVTTPEPYTARRQHGVILGEDGEKMSKSRGNVVNPEEVSNKFGSDTLRIYLMFMGPYDQTMPWNSKGVEGSWRFLNRVWRLVNESRIMNNESRIMNKEQEKQLERKMHQTIKKVTEDIQNLKHNTAIATIMEYVNALYASNSKFEILNSKYVENLILLLAPFAPFIAEELWTNVLGNQFSVHQQSWPKFDPALVQEDEIIVVVQINGKLRGSVKIKNQRSKIKSEVEDLVNEDKNIQKYLDGKEIKKVIFVPGKLINFVV